MPEKEIGREKNRSFLPAAGIFARRGHFCPPRAFLPALSRERSMEDARRRRRLTENARDGRVAAREVRRAAPRSSLAPENPIAPRRRAPEDGAISIARRKVTPRSVRFRPISPPRAAASSTDVLAEKIARGAQTLSLADRGPLRRATGRRNHVTFLKLHRSFSLPTRVTHVHLHARVPARRGIARLASRTNIRAHARRMFSRASLVHVRSQTRTLDASRSR